MFNSKKILQLLALSSLITMSSAGASTAAEKRIFGLHEKLYIADIGLELDAKLDTGAQTASLSARDIEQFSKDGKPWVRFRLAIDGAPANSFELPIVRISHIKRRSSNDEAEDSTAPDYIERPVVLMTVYMGDQQHAIQVNLTDRSRFEFPVLLGSTALKQFNAIIDPSITYTTDVLYDAPSDTLQDTNESEH